MRKLFALMIVLMLCLVSEIVFAATGKVFQQLCSDPRYFCTTAQRGERWETLFPDAALRKIVMEVNRINMQLRPGMVFAVPKDLGAVSMNDLSPFGRSTIPTGESVLIYDPSLLAWGAFDSSGQLIRWGAAAGGSDWCSDVGRSCRTTVGRFRIYSVGGASCVSSKYPLPKGGAPMPYCMFFSKGQALHGSYHVPGFNASHGCVRLFVDDAQWLHSQFINVGRNGTLVIVRPYHQRSSLVWDEKED